MRRRGKAFALSTAAVGVVVLVVAGFVLTLWIVEEYHMRRLSSSQEETRLAAAEALSEMKSLRAVPHLVVLLAAERREIAQRWTVTTNANSQEGISLTPLAYGLYRMGPEALPWLSEAGLERMFQSCEQLRVADKYSRKLLAEIASAISTAGRITVRLRPYAEDAYFGKHLR